MPEPSTSVLIPSCIADLSHRQGPNVDFPAARADGIDWVILKASEGAGIDARFGDYYRAAAMAGIASAGYHFVTGDDTAKQQAETFLHTAGKCRLLAVDYEREPAVFHRASAAIDQVVELLEYVDRYDGRPQLVYLGSDGRDDLIKRRDLWPYFAKHELWHPEYGPDTHAVLREVWPAGPRIWQYTGDGVVARNPDGTPVWRTAVHGLGVDLDLSHFLGTPADLGTLFGLYGPPAPPATAGA